MAKDTFYFSHDYNTRNDDKIKKLLFKYGMVGYGVWWAIVEDLYNNTNVLPLDYDSIAYHLRAKSSTVQGVINDFDLFVVSEKTFSSTSIQERLNRKNEKSIKAKESINKRWENTNVLQSNYGSNTIKESKVKESKRKEKKGNEMKEVKKDAKPLPILFRDSVFFDLTKFKNEFIGTKYEIYNLEFYYEKVLNWSNSGNAKKIDWIATARNFMLGDAEKGKGILQNQNLTQNGNGTNKKQSGNATYAAKLASEME